MLLCDSIHSIRSLWHTLLSFICRLEYIEIHIAANKTKFEANVNCEAHIYKFRYHQTHKGFQLAELQFAWLVGLHAFDLSFGSFAFRWKTHREWWSIWTFSILLPLIKSINIVLRDWCEIKSACALSFFFLVLYWHLFVALSILYCYALILSFFFHLCRRSDNSFVCIGMPIFQLQSEFFHSNFVLQPFHFCFCFHLCCLPRLYVCAVSVFFSGEWVCKNKFDYSLASYCRIKTDSDKFDWPFPA